MSDKNKVPTPLSSSPNFDAMQVMPFHPHRSAAVSATSVATTHPLGGEDNDTDMIHLKVVIAGDTSAWPHVDITVGEAVAWPHEAGNHYWGAVGLGQIVISYAGDGTATVYVMEA